MKIPSTLPQASLDSNLNPLESLSKKEEGSTPEKAREVAKDFEGLFVSVLLKSMRQTVGKEEQSHAEEIYESMKDEEFVKAIAESDQFGIQRLVNDWLTQNHPSSIHPPEKRELSNSTNGNTYRKQKALQAYQ